MSKTRPVIGITTDLKQVDNEPSNAMDRVYTDVLQSYGSLAFLIPALPRTIIDSEGFIAQMISLIDGLLIPGGRDIDPVYYDEAPHPKSRLISKERTDTEFAVLAEALKQKKPVLGICNGMQLINVFMKGSLFQDIPSQLNGALNHENGSVHSIEIVEGTTLRDIVGVKEFSSKSYHHQSVRDIGERLTLAASSPDGVIEGIEGTGENGQFILGVQWHPERERSKVSEAIFNNFIKRCADS